MKTRKFLDIGSPCKAMVIGLLACSTSAYGQNPPGNTIFDLVPIGSTGTVTSLVGHSIVIPTGGAIIELELRASGWAATGDGGLTSLQGTIDGAGFCSGIGDPLFPVGYPTAPVLACTQGEGCPSDGDTCNQGGFIVTTVCAFSGNDGDPCKMNGDCMGGVCTGNSAYILNNHNPIAVVAFPNLNYEYTGVAQSGVKIDGGISEMFGTLLVTIPPGARGTYNINFSLDSDRTVNFDGTAAEFAVVNLNGATITVESLNLDCNANGIEDDCDISCGTLGGACDVAGCGQSLDCDGNNVPDECQIFGTGGPFFCEVGCDSDCNGNGIPDSCDLITGNNCNGNTIPDECESLQQIFVDSAAMGSGHGGNWGNAIINLQDALSMVDCTGGAVNEIWVASGTYVPDRDEANPTGTSIREATFQLRNGVTIYGGFKGNETTLSQRDVAANETILSGDLAGDDAPVPCINNSACAAFGSLCVDNECIISLNNSENSYHVVTGSGNDATAVLDGFTIKDGNANFSGFPNDSGAGMFNDGGNPGVSGCTFRANSANGLGHGGGMYNRNSNPIVIDCSFIGNAANGFADGGGMYNVASSNPIVKICTFSNNYAEFCGGAMFNSGGTSPTMTNCTFNSNSTGFDGGGIYNGSSSPTITNCIFNSNFAVDNGGGMKNNNASVIVTNCTFSENRANFNGGGISNGGSTTTVNNTILWGNVDDADANSGGPFTDESAQIIGTPVVNFSIVQGGWTGAGGIGNSDADPLFVDADGPDDIPGTSDDNLRVLAGSPALDAGDNSAVPADTTDLDNDGNTTEPIPFDLDGKSRFSDDPNTVDTGNGTAPIVDMGAYEPTVSNFNWIALAGGPFLDAVNWDPQGIPVALDSIFFNLDSGGYAITYSADAATNDLSVFTDVVTLALGGFTYTTNNLKIAAADSHIGSLTINGGAVNLLGSLVIGDGVGANGTLNINNTSTVNVGGSIDLSSLGTSNIQVNAGLLDQQNANPFDVGPGSIIDITNGGIIRSGGSLPFGGKTTIGSASGKTARVSIDGPTSLWEMHGPTDIGVVGPAILTISNGGTFNSVSPNVIIIGANGQIIGDGTLIGNFFSSGRIHPGIFVGTLTVTGQYQQLNDGQLFIEIDESGLGNFDQLDISGQATLSGKLDIKQTLSVPPMPGDTFIVMTYGAHLGTFNIVNQSSLEGGLAFQLNYNPNDLTLEVVADCNFNGIPDSEDLANCTGDPDCADCNSNGIPDECDIADCDWKNNPTCGDCNSNGIPDECDIFRCVGGINDSMNCATDADCDVMSGGSCIGGPSIDLVPEDGIPDDCLLADGMDLMDPNNNNYSNGNNWLGGMAAINDMMNTFSATLDGCDANLMLDQSVSVDNMIIGGCASLDVSNGDLTIVDGGRIDVNGDTSGTGDPVDATLIISGTNTVTTPDLLVRNAGSVLLSGLSNLIVTGTLEIDAGGQVAKDPTASVVASSITAGTLMINGGSCASGQDGGQLLLDDKMTLNVTGDLVMNGSLETDCPSSLVTPTPKFDPKNCGTNLRTNGTNVEIGGMLLQSNVTVVVNTGANCARRSIGTISASILVNGNVDNQSTSPLSFDWSTAGIELSGSVSHTFEVAGRDMGADEAGFLLQTCDESLTPCGLTGTPTCTPSCPTYTNESYGLVKIGNNATVTFENSFDNDGYVRGVPEALYVDTLEVGTGVTVNLVGCNVYYRTLSPPDFMISTMSTGMLLPLPILIASPVAALAPHNITKDRYLSFDPSPNAGQSTALRVTRVGSTTSWYVSCSLEDAGVDGMLSTLVPTAKFCDWTDSVIHVRGCEIVPGNEYLIAATANDTVFSSSLSVLTTPPQFDAGRQFGDTVGGLMANTWTAPDGLVTANDIVAVVQKFQLNPTAPHISRMDGDGNIPNGIVAGNDILREVIGFASGEFGFGVTDCLTGKCVPSCP